MWVPLLRLNLFYFESNHLNNMYMPCPILTIIIDRVRNIHPNPIRQIKTFTLYWKVAFGSGVWATMKWVGVSLGCRTATKVLSLNPTISWLGWKCQSKIPDQTESPKILVNLIWDCSQELSPIPCDNWQHLPIIIY